MRAYWVYMAIFLMVGLAMESYAQNITLGGAEKSEQDDNTALKLARQYYSSEEYEKALSYLDKFPKNHPSREIYELRLGCYLALEEYRDAERLIEGQIKLIHGNHSNYSADLLYVYLLQKKESKADKLVEETLAEVAQRPSMAYSYGTAFQQKGYPAIALEIYEEAEKYMPNANFEYQKALLYGELGDIQKMYATYVSMVETTPTYLPTVKQLLGRALQEDVNSENSEFLKQLLIERIQKGGPETLNELLVFIFIKEENFNGAFVQLKALDRRQGGNKAAIYRLGTVALNNEEYSLAGRIFEYVLKDGPSNPFYEQAVVGSLSARRAALEANNSVTNEEWLKLKDAYKKAVQDLKGRQEVGVLSIEMAHFTAFQLNDVNEAEAMLRTLLSTGYISEEDIAKAKMELADILLYRGDRWEAILLYGQAEQAFEQSPIGQEAKFKRARAAYFVGDFNWAQGIFDALKASTTKLIANDAMRYSLLINDNIALDTSMEAMKMYARADLMYYQGKNDSALRVLDMMDIAFPGHSIQDEVLFLKGGIYAKQKQFHKAADEYRRLIDEYSKDILADDAMYALAEICEYQLDKGEEAMELYRRIFTDHPDSFFAPDARRKFREMRGDKLIN